MYKTDSLTPSPSFTSSLSLEVGEIRDKVGAEVKDGMGVVDGVKLPEEMRDGVWGGVRHHLAGKAHIARSHVFPTLAHL